MNQGSREAETLRILEDDRLDEELATLKDGGVAFEMTRVWTRAGSVA